MSNKRTAERNGQPDVASVINTNVLDLARSIYADMKAARLTREDIWLMLGSLILVAVNGEVEGIERAKQRRKKRRRPKTKGHFRV